MKVKISHRLSPGSFNPKTFHRYLLEIKAHSFCENQAKNKFDNLLLAFNGFDEEPVEYKYYMQQCRLF